MRCVLPMVLAGGPAEGSCVGVLPMVLGVGPADGS